MPVDAPQLLATPAPQATTDSSLGTSQCGEGTQPDLTSDTHPLQVSEHPPPAPVQRFLTGSTLLSTLPLLLDEAQGNPRRGLCARLLGSRWL